MNDPTSDLEAWAASYREQRRPSPARRRAIRAGVLEGAAAQDRQIRRQRWVGLGVVLAAGVLGALALGQLLGGRAVRLGTDDHRSLAPRSAQGGGAHALDEGRGEDEHEGTPRSPAIDPAATEPAVMAPPESADDDAAAAPSPVSAPSGTTRREGAERRRSTAPAADPAPLPTPSTADELEGMRLLRDAERRLDTDAAASLRLLERHAERFPGSSLALEREALTVIALCRLDRVEAGRERQRAFLQLHGRSAYAARVRSACQDPASADR